MRDKKNMKPFVLWLEDIRPDHLALVGGKAKNLGVLITAGISVPPGFCVTTEVYKRVLAESGLEDRIFEITRLFQTRDLSDLEQKTQYIRDLILSINISNSVIEACGQAYQELGSRVGSTNVYVAVRSSATYEDLPEASFAGQHETFLNIVGEDQIIEYLKRCWASLWSVRAVVYRTNRGFDHSKISLAVVIQYMIQADKSGVMFTINPISGSKDEIVLNSGRGLGEAVVSGIVTPDSYVVRRAVLSTAHQNVSQRLRKIARVQFRKIFKAFSSHLYKQGSLTQEEVIHLAELGVQIEEYYKAPQDIEWSIQGKNIYILQTRPITVLDRETVPTISWEDASIPHAYWTRRFLFEWFRSPLSPLFATFQVPALFNETVSLIYQRIGVGLRRPHTQVLHGYLYVRGDAVIAPQVLLAPIKIIQDLKGINRVWQETIVTNHVKKIDALHSFDVDKAEKNSLFNYIEEVTNVSAAYCGWNIYTGVFCILADVIFRNIYQLISGREATPYSVLLLGLPNKTSEAEIELWNLASYLKKSTILQEVMALNSYDEVKRQLLTSASGREFLNHLENFLGTYGHRVFDLDILHPTAQEDPALMFNALRRYVQLPEDESPIARFKKQEQERGRATTLVLNQVGRNSLGRWIFVKALSLAQRYALIREDRPFYLHMGWPLMRRAALKLGERLTKDGFLYKPDDIFFLTKDEIRQLTTTYLDIDPIQLSKQVTDRRLQRELQLTFMPPEDVAPSFWTRFLLGVLERRQDSVRYNEIIGIPGSSGSIRGKARIILSPKDFSKMERGVVVVAPFITPAWTSLFPMAAAVVTDEGGALAHGAIVAREHGIPAVMGTKVGTKRIQDGQTLEVDGDRGIVWILD